jgi:hypothetical protein
LAVKKNSGGARDIENMVSDQDDLPTSALDEAVAVAAKSRSDNQDSFSMPIGSDAVQLLRLNTKYVVEEASTIKELSTEFATAYKIREKKLLRKSVGDTEQYMLVFQKNFAPRIRAIAKLMGGSNGNFQNVSEAGTVYLEGTGQTHFAIILPYVNGTRLSTILAKEGQLPEKFITQIIIPSVNNALNFLAKYGVLHGNINPNTLIFQPELERIVVTECFSNYCGFTQPSFYEPLERAQCSPIAKGEADETADLFALGAVCATALQGSGLFDSGKEASLLAERFVKSTYNAYVVQPERFGAVKDFLRGVLQDHPSERWSVEDVLEWQARKKSSVSNTEHPLKESLTGYDFNGKSHLGRRALAHEMYLHWTPAKLEVKIEELGRWLRLNVMRADLSDELDSTIGPARRKDAVIQDDDLTKVITVLDSDGPIRHNEFSASGYGLPQMLAYGLGRGKREYGQFVADCFNHGLLMQWLELQPALEDYDYYKMYWNPTAVAKYLRIGSLGFGLERALYDMNPGLPCQSQMIAKSCVLSLDELLKALDEIAEEAQEKSDPMDRHMAAYIGSKLHLDDEIRIKSVRHFPQFAKSPQLLMLALLTLAQAETKTKNLKNLCRWILKRVVPLIDSVQGKSIRKEFQAAVIEAAKSGDIQELFTVITSPNFIKRDAFGLSEAMKQYHRVTTEINSLKKQDSIERVAYQYGLKIAVLSSYAVCFGTMLALVMQL